jgi:predicted HAD superfamily Cof-like phosphohydrolase
MTVDKQAREFHDRMGLETRTTPGLPSDRELRLAVRVVAEEFFEVLEAIFGTPAALSLARWNLEALFDHPRPPPPGLYDRLPELAKELADLDYVVAGVRVAFGIEGAPVAALVHASNMAKLAGPRRADGKILKPLGWQAPDIVGELRRQGWVGSVGRAAP